MSRGVRSRFSSMRMRFPSESIPRRSIRPPKSVATCRPIMSISIPRRSGLSAIQASTSSSLGKLPFETATSFSFLTRYNWVNEVRPSPVSTPGHHRTAKQLSRMYAHLSSAPSGLLPLTPPPKCQCDALICVDVGLQPFRFDPRRPGGERSRFAPMSAMMDRFSPSPMRQAKLAVTSWVGLVRTVARVSTS